MRFTWQQPGLAQDGGIEFKKKKKQENHIVLQW